MKEILHKITPALMYTGDQFGKAEEAIDFYTSIFKNSEITFLSRYEKRGKFQNGKIKHGEFNLIGQSFIAMDSIILNDLSFSEGNSMVVECDYQDEIDYCWNALANGGEERWVVKR